MKQTKNGKRIHPRAMGKLTIGQSSRRGKKHLSSPAYRECAKCQKHTDNNCHIPKGFGGGEGGVRNGGGVGGGGGWGRRRAKKNMLHQQNRVKTISDFGQSFKHHLFDHSNLFFFFSFLKQKTIPRVECIIQGLLFALRISPQPSRSSKRPKRTLTHY